jgi:aminoglycoside 3-N-acetyltransferase
VPVLRNGGRLWVEFEDFDSSRGIAGDAEENFQCIVKEYLASGKGCSDRTGAAQSYLFSSNDLVEFAVKWLENKFGET